jgi:predicted nucleic acid-binding Zn ribbon protein
MTLTSLHRVLGSLRQQEGWKTGQQFQHLLACWVEVVGAAVAAQTRPTAIYRDVLQVATSSSVWAQNLVFERHRILEKLNPRLSSPLTDIRFSTAQWHQHSNTNARDDEASAMWQDHPSQLRTIPLSPQIGGPQKSTDPNRAFQNWAKTMRMRSQHLPLCPQCQCPTPPGELKRWSVCALCATKQWSSLG